MKKRIFAFLLCLSFLIPAAALHPAAKVYTGKALDEDFILHDTSSGTGGSDSEEDPAAPQPSGPETPSEELTKDEALSLAPNYQIMYELNTDTKVLRIWCSPEKGEQAMLPYAKASWIPWIGHAEQRGNIETAYIEEGVQSLGRYSFFNCDTVKTVYLPHSLTKVDKIVFYRAKNLETIYYAGTKEDFEQRVLWVDYQNTLTGSDDRAYDKIHFGEHVTVECKNQDGYVFSSYTVGGYHTGDAYTINAKTFSGLTLEGAGSFGGNFKKKDDTTYTFTYRCEHHFVKNDPDKPCADICEHCGMPNPEGRDHTWLTEVISARGFLTKEEIHETCTVCGAEKHESKPAYFWYVLIGGGALGVVAGVSFAIAYPIRKKKKLQDLTW